MDRERTEGRADGKTTCLSPPITVGAGGIKANIITMRKYYNL